MNEDFTEEEDFDELPEGVEFADDEEPAPAPKPKPKPRPVVQPQKQTQPRREARRPNPPATAEPPQERYTPFMMPSRVGIFDNVVGKPLMEDQKTNALILGVVTKILNDIEEIKKNL
jgi:hypothetical protein